MKLEHDFEVDAELHDAWPLLLDLERIAPCMPGAQLQEVDGDEYRGIVKVKVGPITAQYRGAARVVEADEAARKVVLRAEGRDTRGQGNAAADIIATLQSEGSKTRVHVDTDLNVTGKVAQFGRGVMADVSAKLMDQFVSCLSTTVLSGGGNPAPAPAPAAAPAAPGATEAPEPKPVAATPAAPAAPGATEAPEPKPVTGASAAPAPRGPRRIDAPEAEAVDLVRAAGGAVAKRVVPLVAVALVVIGVVVWLLVR
ncbi:MAG TPA: SRPBCC family protein [Acidimicrobiia bacterium]